MYVKTQGRRRSNLSKVKVRLGSGQFASPCPCGSGGLGLEGIGSLDSGIAAEDYIRGLGYSATSRVKVRPEGSIGRGWNRLGEREAFSAKPQKTRNKTEGSGMLSVKVVWPKGQPTKAVTTHYAVKAETLEEAGSILKRKPDKHWGKTTWGPEKEGLCPKKPAECFCLASVDKKDRRVKEVTIRPNIRIKLPRWTGYAKAPKSCKNEWDRMLRALTRHEDNHRLIVLEGVAKLVWKLRNTPKGSLTSEELIRICDETEADIQKNANEYDARTDSGRNEGVYLDTKCSGSGLITSDAFACVTPRLGGLRLGEAQSCTSSRSIPLADTPQPCRFYTIKSGVDNKGLIDLAGRAYGTQTDKTKLAQWINNHPYNRRFWKADLANKDFPQGRISFSPGFSRDIAKQAEATGKAPSGGAFATIFIPPPPAWLQKSFPSCSVTSAR